MRLVDTVLHNFISKLVALILAISTWFYVFDLVNSESFKSRNETVEEVFSKYKFAAKDVTVKPILTGKPATGYNVILDNIKVTPSRITVFAPEDIIEDVTELRTERINIGEYTKPVTLRLKIYSDVKFLKLKDKIVEVYIPVFPDQEVNK